VRDIGSKKRKDYESTHSSCKVLSDAPETLADLLQILATPLLNGSTFWFRGQGSFAWDLTPSALRLKDEAHRSKALGLLGEFKRVATMKLERPPEPSALLDWVQLAQHYGLPTRLLDWTQNPASALWFACAEPAKDGAIFLINPVDLNRASHLKLARICDVEQDREAIQKVLQLDGKIDSKGPHTIAVQPVWNSERIMRQQGVFTLHGSRELSLSHTKFAKTGVPSLMCIPILADEKVGLRRELTRIGIDEMSLFPELEHACSHLTLLADLPRL
jgi:hypothetical protein